MGYLCQIHIIEMHNIFISKPEAEKLFSIVLLLAIYAVYLQHLFCTVSQKPENNEFFQERGLKYIFHCFLLLQHRPM